MINILAKIFGSPDRLKLLRLFLLNTNDVFPVKIIAKRAKIKAGSLRREIKLLFSIGFIIKKKKNAGKKKIEGWALDSAFPLLFPLKKLVLDAMPVTKKDLLKKLGRIGRLKMVVLAGIFIHKDDSRVDLLVVGDKLKKNILEKVLKEIEAEIGKELDYAFFETKDFLYRLNIYDKFIRDILDYPHQSILDKLNL